MFDTVLENSAKKEKYNGVVWSIERKIGKTIILTFFSRSAYIKTFFFSIDIDNLEKELSMFNIVHDSNNNIKVLRATQLSFFFIILKNMIYNKKAI